MFTEAIADLLKELEVEPEIRSRVIVEVRDMENKLEHMNATMKEIVDAVSKLTALVVGKQTNGDFEFGLIYKYEQIKRELKIIKAGVWVIAGALIAGLAKIIFFGGI